MRTLATALGAKMGRTAEQMMADFPLRIVGENPAAPGEALNATDDPQFSAWFGDSKVVDEKGAPLVVYHGTSRDFDAFDPSETFDGGLYFTDNADHAAEYAEIKGGGDTQIMPVYLTIRDPMEIDARSSDLGNQFNEDWQQLLQQLILAGTQAGNDGVIVRNMDALGYGDDSTIYIAFRPEQIKSVFNRGTWDANDPNILNQRAPSSRFEVRREKASGRYCMACARGENEGAAS